MANISIDDLADEITESVKLYTEDVCAAIDITLDDAAKAILMDAAMNAPHSPGGGDYARSFRITNQDDFYKTKRVIWNKKHYRLVHLLEFGHAYVNGKRYEGCPHLRPAYEKHGARLPNDIKKIIENGG